MNSTDLIERANLLLSKYEKYTPEATDAAAKSKPKGAFDECYVDLIDQINTLTLRVEETGNELNRAMRAAQNAEIRKAKAILLDTGLPRLEKLVNRGKNLSKDTIEQRQQKVQQVREGIAGIADGVSGNRRPRKPLNPLTAKGSKRQKPEIQLSGEADGRQHSPGYYKRTEASDAFRQEWEVAKARQDKALDNIEKGLGVLKGLGEAMGENLSQQDVLLTEMETKMDAAGKGLKTNNMKLKGLVTQMSSSRNFCVDVALVCILLAMGLWIYELFR